MSIDCQRLSRPPIEVIVLFVALVICVSITGVAASDKTTALSNRPVILVVGDSLSAGYGLSAGEGWVWLLEQKLIEEQLPHGVVNASVSGETTAGGLARLPTLLERHKPEIVLIELGANDGLRALPVKRMKDNLRQMSQLSREAGAKVALFQMSIPSNYGPAYTDQFIRAFGEIANVESLTLVPFLLQQFATDLDAFQEDGIHPAAGAQALMLDTIWPSIEPLLRKQASTAASEP